LSFSNDGTPISYTRENRRYELIGVQPVSYIVTVRAFDELGAEHYRTLADITHPACLDDYASEISPRDVGLWERVRRDFLFLGGKIRSWQAARQLDVVDLDLETQLDEIEAELDRLEAIARGEIPASPVRPIVELSCDVLVEGLDPESARRIATLGSDLGGSVRGRRAS